MSQADRRTARLRKGFTLVEALVVAMIVGVLLAILLPAIEAARPYRPPTIPDREPGEERRVYLPIGLSIIRPLGWEVIIHRQDDWSTGVMSLEYPEPFSASLRVRWSTTRPEPEADSEEITFQRRPAWLKIERQAPTPWFLGSVRREAGQRESRGYLSAKLVTSRDDRWIELDFSCFGDHPDIPPIIWKYLYTLEFATPTAAADRH